ncbi:MAG: sigma-70 family RNA polymerase sigma factor [Planctomycetaceae bacterium]|nr:sigma-70 family RNA polymerase sigma factor [Planctomycetaceae bacterium]
MVTGNTSQLLLLAAEGNEAAREELFGRHRSRLRRFVAVRLDRRLQGRLDGSDILQDVYLEASRRLTEFQQRRPCSFYLWLRLICAERMVAGLRAHLRAGKRTVAREVAVNAQGVPTVDTDSMVLQLLESGTSPSGVAMQEELRQQVSDVLNRLSAADREILVLRHFEQLTNVEAAEVLNITASTASSRYVRALKRLKQELSSIPGFEEW